MSMFSHKFRHASAKPTEVQHDRSASVATIESDDLLRPPSIVVSRSPSRDSQLSPPDTPGSLASGAGSGDANSPSSVGKDFEKKRRRLSWFGRSKPEQRSDDGPSAWVLGYHGRVPYDLGDLVEGRLVTELWDSSGDCFIHLSSRQSGQPPSFRVHSSIFSSSRVLNEFLDEEKHIYLPTGPDVVPGTSESSTHTEALVATRNLFAVLAGKTLVATPNLPSASAVFLEVSRLLKLYDFTNVDGSTNGEVVTSNFDRYIDELGLADVRASPEKTIEGIILGERMKNVKLYTESFTHAVGNHQSIHNLGSSNFALISQVSQNRLSRAALDLEKQTETVTRVLGDLDLSCMFSGIMTSRTAPERKHVDFDEWKSSFHSMRKFFIGFYKQRYRHWPPKAPSKQSVGLNRLVLQDVYQDLCSLYDLLVDRRNISHRVENNEPPDANEEPMASAMRQVLDEYDRSSPPVKPPIPFDTPRVPSLKSTRPDFGSDEKNDATAASKDLKDDEISKILQASHNPNQDVTPVVEAFRAFEQKRAHSKNIKELADHRAGHWMFIYALLQVLPLVVVDAPGMRYVQDVEYFLCQAPRSGVPWAAKEDSNNPNRLSDETAATLPADMIEPGIEGVYRRSHCWIMAEKWRPRDSGVSIAIRPRAGSMPAPGVDGGQWHSEEGGRTVSGDAAAAGVEAGGLQVPSQAGGVRGRRQQKARPISVYDPTKTFDVILKHAAEENKINRE